MSSILKALKKLENKSENMIDANEPVQIEVSEHSISSFILERLTVQSAFKTGGIFLLLLGFVWLVINFNLDPGNPPTQLNQDVHEKKIPVKIQKIDSETELEPKMEPLPLEVKPHPIAVKPKENENAAPEINSEILPEEDAQETKITKTIPTAKNEFSDHDPVTIEKTLQQTEISTIDKPEQPDKYSDVETIIDSSWLTLQAISYTSDPLTRIAVINNQIVKEGKSVEKGKVLHIDKTFVIIQEGAKEWKLEFGLK